MPRFLALPILCTFVLAACAAMPPAAPINTPSANPAAGEILPQGLALEGDAIVLSLSGGGARATAFALGVMEGLRRIPAGG